MSLWHGLSTEDEHYGFSRICLLQSPSILHILCLYLCLTLCLTTSPPPVPAYVLLDSVYFSHACLLTDFLKDFHLLGRGFAFIFSSKGENYHLPNDFFCFLFFSSFSLGCPQLLLSIHVILVSICETSIIFNFLTPVVC